jgi:hypothetical protein
VTPVTATALLDIAWRNALLSLPLPAGSGPWQVTITVGTGPDRLQEQLSVAPTAGILLGDAMLSRARPVARAPLRPAATFQFSRSERAHVEWPLLAPIDRREARLLDSRGQPLNVPIAVSEVTTPTTAIAADLNLGSLANGDYVIEMRASAGETTVVRHAAIRVGQ